jgi:hypothetical protein
MMTWEISLKALKVTRPLLVVVNTHRQTDGTKSYTSPEKGKHLPVSTIYRSSNMILPPLQDCGGLESL